MPPFGVIECFYGLAWSTQDRESYARFLQQNGFNFYIYGPKGDESLRKKWAQAATPQELTALKTMREVFAQQHLQFGIALSPQGLNAGLDLAMREKLQEKVKVLSDVGIDFLGLFFDDMKSAPDMAERQIEIIHLVERTTQAKVIFCPSYYCQDSLLDLLFGERPQAYLEKLGQGLSSKVEVLWTGEEIISPEIGVEHLREVSKALRRKPFICDNFYANDGPINCDFLRLVPPTGRERAVFAEASGWAINPMNQAQVSKIVLAAFAKFAKGAEEPLAALQQAVLEIGKARTGAFLLEHAHKFATEGLSEFSEEIKGKWQSLLSADTPGDLEKELVRWLAGHYAVGLESIVDQSCYEGA